jgi:uncharacterized protein YndB with AHSA1/START domain
MSMVEDGPREVSTSIEAPVEAVFRALTVPEQVREWFGYDYPGLDEEIRVGAVEGAKHVGPQRIEYEDGSVIMLTPDGTRTVVKVVLPGSLTDAEWNELYDGVWEGWRTYFEQMRFWLEAAPPGRRRTVYLTGSAAGATLVGLLAGGRVWFDGPRHRIVVDSAGHLLAAASKEDLSAPGEARVNLVVTTYGLDDAAFAEVRDSWAARWREVAKDAEVIL